MKKNESTINALKNYTEISRNSPFLSLSAIKPEEEAVQEKDILRKTVMSKAQACTLFILCKKPIHSVTTRTCLFRDTD